MQIYVHKNNQQLGPYTEADIRAQLAAGTISLQDHVWWQGQASWLPLGQTSLVGPAAPGIAPAAVVPPVPHPPGAIPLPATVQTSQLAIWSLVCACVSIVCGIFTLIPAIILGHMSLAEIKKHPGMQGRGLAISGLAISYAFLAIAILAVSAVVLLGAVSNNVKDVFKTITSQLNAEQGNTSSDDSTTNAADQSTNTPTATPTNSADSSTNSATATPTSPDSSTNAAPANQ